MAYQSIGIGTVADDGTGDTLRSGGGKVNDNFVELYTLLGTGLALSSGISATATVVSLTAPTISGVVGGTQTSATITTLTSTTVNAGTLALAAGSVTDSSGAINFGNENLVTTGTFGAAVTTLGALTCGTITSTGATIVFEGETTNDHQTTLAVTDPTADRTITFPDINGIVITTGDSGTVTTAMIASDAVTADKIGNDIINSEHYVDGSIDLVHMSANSVDSDQYVDGSIRTEHLAANSVDSGHYIDGSIRTEHLAANSVDSAQYVDGSIDPEHLSSAASEVADGSIGYEKLQNVQSLILYASAPTTATANCNGAISSSTALVVDGNSGTIAVGMIVSGTGVGTTNPPSVITVTDQNNLVLSHTQTIANNVVLTFTLSLKILRTAGDA